MIKLDALNSRMKDFYDIWLLNKRFNFQNLELQKAIHLTLQNRKTELPVVITAFTDDFIKSLKMYFGFYNNERPTLLLGAEHLQKCTGNMPVTNRQHKRAIAVGVKYFKNASVASTEGLVLTYLTPTA